MQKINLQTLWHKKNCAGWAFRACDRAGRYMWQNANDLGLFGEDLDTVVYITKKIKVAKGLYLYLITWRTSIETDGTDNTLVQIKSYLRYQWGEQLTKHDKTLVERVQSQWLNGTI